jgi:signal transduction histidine kinase
VVCPRDRRVRLDRDEARLLRDLARQVGAAVHAVQLSADLQASRRRLVSAKEEERRRLRRDLHDGLGPKLAAVILKLDAVEAITETRPEQGRQVLAGVQRDIRETIADVRQLVYGLRPPTLDDLGLVGALGECAARFDDTADAPQISVTADQLPPTLPAAVEVAAYWIATEAMTNAVRHAGAAHCAVRVWLAADILELRITDDGRGLAPDARAGVGTTSMRERAAELGGTVTIDSRPDGQGVEVVASIPCGAWT